MQGRLRRAIWSGLLGGTLGGLVTSQVIAILLANDSLGISPWLYGLLILLCIAALTWIAHDRFARYLPQYALRETIGAFAGMWLGLLILSPSMNRYAVSEGLVLYFFPFTALTGLGIGGVLGLVTGAVMGLLDQDVMDALRPWSWLLGVVLAVFAMGGFLVVDQFGFVPGLALVVIPGSALAGWIAQQEYLRLESNLETKQMREEEQE